MTAANVKKLTKSSSIKIKSSEKKKTNRWLITGGVALVVIVGIVIVRLSSAATWHPIESQKVSALITIQANFYSLDFRGTKAGTYHVCFTGYSTGVGGSTARITYNQRAREVAYKTTSSKQCSYAQTFTNPLLDGGSSGYIKKLHGANIKITSTSIEGLR